MVEGGAVVCGRGWGCHVVEGGAVWWRAGLSCVVEGGADMWWREGLSCVMEGGAVVCDGGHAVPVLFTSPRCQLQRSPW